MRSSFNESARILLARRNLMCYSLMLSCRCARVVERQTQETQNLPLARVWGFESLLGHQIPQNCCFHFYQLPKACSQATAIKLRSVVLAGSNGAPTRPLRACAHRHATDSH